MDLRENAASRLLDLNGLDVFENSAVSGGDAEIGLAGMALTDLVDEEEAPEFAYGFQREPVGST